VNARPSLRWRLTALYAVLFFLAGGVLLLINYRLVEGSIPDDKILFTRSVLAPGPGVIAGGSEVRPPEDAPIGVVGPDGTFGIIMNGEPADKASIERLPGRLREQALNNLLARSFMGLALVGVASVMLGWWLSGRALRPIHQITDTARRLSETNLDERIALQGPNDELRELADTFDAMLERLDTAFDSQRQFVANASHELRTPLAIMRTQLEVAQTPEELAAASVVVQQVIDRSERLVEGLLVLARAGGQFDLQPTDLADAVESARSASSGPGADVQVAYRLDPAPVDGDAALLTHLVRNLLDNARRYNKPGGWAHVFTSTEDDEAVLTVENTGPPVPADDIESLFEPFRRLAPDRTASDTSAGLGLSIVRAVADTHGGTVTATARDDGGLRVVVRLPTSQPFR
jgi:signal transduction histidine kinase